jgi:methyltransferase
MLQELVGAPQMAAAALLVQRGVEELYSQRNTRALIAAGAFEVGRSFYPVVAVTHLAWIASLLLLVSPRAPVSWPLLAAYLALQGARYWVIGVLGRYWTHRIITLPGAPLVRRGPYRYISHPNYLVSIMETFLLPAVFGAWVLAVIMTAVWSAVLHYKIGLENQALAERRAVPQP